MEAKLDEQLKLNTANLFLVFLALGTCFKSEIWQVGKF